MLEATLDFLALYSSEQSLFGFTITNLELRSPSVDLRVLWSNIGLGERFCLMNIEPYGECYTNF